MQDHGDVSGSSAEELCDTNPGLILKEAHNTPAGIYELLITDLPVTHGDSGSGLFDERGQLVGLNTWTKVEGGLAHGISLPSEAMRALSDAVQNNELDRLNDMLPKATLGGE